MHKTYINWYITTYMYHELAPKHLLVNKVFDWLMLPTPPTAPVSVVLTLNVFFLIEMGLSGMIKKCRTYVPETIEK